MAAKKSKTETAVKGGALEEKILSGEMPKTKKLFITPPNFHRMTLVIRGTAPLVQNKLPNKIIKEIADRHEEGDTPAKKGKKVRPPKDFEANYHDCQHRPSEGGGGIPASAFRNAAIRACTLCGFVMALAKLCIFTEANDYDKDDGTPLVRITKGEPHMIKSAVRLPSGNPDIHARAMWGPGWEAVLTMKYDADQFSDEAFLNLMHRVGLQVGVQEGRPGSTNSAGMGWGTFEIVSGELAD